MHAGVLLLRSGAQSDDVEEAIAGVAAAYGVAPVHAAVTFSIISVSHDTPTTDPITLVHIVRERTTDFGHLAAAASVVRRIRDTNEHVRFLAARGQEPQRTWVAEGSVEQAELAEIAWIEANRALFSR